MPVQSHVFGRRIAAAVLGLVLVGGGGAAASAAPATPAAPTDISAWQVTQTRLGPYRLGQSIAAAQKAGHMDWRKNIQAAVDFNAAMSGGRLVACPGDGQVNVPLVKGPDGDFLMGVVSVPCNHKAIAKKSWWARTNPLKNGRVIGLTMQRMSLNNSIIGGLQVVKYPTVQPGGIRLLDDLPALKPLFPRSKVKRTTGWNAVYVDVFRPNAKHIDATAPRLQFAVMTAGDSDMVMAVSLRSTALINPSWEWWQ